MGTMRGIDPTEMLALARLACDVPDEIDDAPVFTAIRALLDDYDAYAAEPPEERRRLSNMVRRGNGPSAFRTHGHAPDHQDEVERVLAPPEPAQASLF